MAYLYRHIRLDKNQPFYIGISLKDDSKYKRASRKDRTRSKYWTNITNKTNYRVEILFDNETPEFIKEKEIEFIKLYGRIDLKNGCLVNMTDGGEGTRGFKHSIESRKNMSISQRKRGLTKHNIRLIENSKKSIIQYDKNMNYITEFSSITECKNFYCLDSRKLLKIIKNNIIFNNFIFCFK